jgi:plastocyanin
MIDQEFEPTQLELEAGSEVEIQVTNDGDQVHNFTIDDLDLSTGTMESGDVMIATFTVPEGTTEFHCTFHSGMDGEIVAT